MIAQSMITSCGRRSRARQDPIVGWCTSPVISVLSPSGSMPLSDPFYELLAQGGEVECGLQRVDERHPVEHRPRVEIFTQDHTHLPEAGDCPDLSVVVGEHVLPDAPQGFEHHGAGERQYREGEHEALYLPPYRRRIRPGLELSQARAPEFGEDLRR